MLILPLLLAASVCPDNCQSRPAIDTLQWMTGDWETQDGQQWTEEHWTLPRAGVMLGNSRSGHGPRADSFEFLRIATDGNGALIYWGAPEGEPAVPFRLVRSGAGFAEFENPDHDYPQRIRYELARDHLVATISDLKGGKRMSWSYRKK